MVLYDYNETTNKTATTFLMDLEIALFSIVYSYKMHLLVKLNYI